MDVLEALLHLARLGAETPLGDRLLDELARERPLTARALKEALDSPRPAEALAALVADHLAERVAEGWDRWGAPSAARTPEGRWVGSFEGPGGAYAVEAGSKREAYRLARREWLRRLLGG